MLIASVLLAAATVAPTSTPGVPASARQPVPEAVVGAVAEQLRMAEMLLDADAFSLHLAHSFTFIEDGARIAGAFAYLELIRHLRARKAEVKTLTWTDRRVDVFGASAVVTYRLDEVWVDRGTRHRRTGWCTDVYERRDDGAWLLVHRHR